ncbi:MAG TPA: AAA family ATPase [Dehalococcoidia bacterium]|nr:AAA family ATPase [Dehalococcoidia bacterium]
MPVELTAEQVRERCDPNLFECDSTAELTPADSIIGQERALSALKFGLHIQKPGFNIYVAGPAGTGKATVIKSFLEALAADKEIPPDWCYVHNFRDPYCPKALKVPAGTGLVLQKDMKHAIENARKSLVQAFGSKEYEERRSEIVQELSRKRETAFNSISEKARERDLILKTTQIGLILMPASKGEAMSEEEYQKLSPEAKEELANARDELGKELKDLISELQTEERAIEQKLEDSDHEVAEYAIDHTFQELKNKYRELPQVVAYLDEVEQNIIENYEQFKSEQATQGPEPLLSAMQEQARKRSLQNYEVNVVVDNSELKGAPSILELNPTFNNLFGLIEKESQFGALYTDFTMIRGGSLHKANGGYLALRIEDLLTNFLSWEGLKRTLRDGKLSIEEVAERLGFVATKTLRPEPIPLDIKVVIIGEPMFYYLLLRADMQFQELFKVKADFDSQMDKSEACLKQYASVICRLCQEEELRHLKSDALARIIEHSSRLAGDCNKLSTLFANIADIIREANFWSGEDGTKLIEAEHIEKAIEQRVYRSNLIQQRISEMIETGMIRIETEGEGIGEVNGLAVIDLGDFAFGRPSRITASVSVGREGLIDIEREAKLGGRLHTKGVMILNGYIHDRYARDIPLSLSARLVFEQSYEEVDGDSASSTELYSLLSCLSGVPIKRGIAVTGSVNQKGEVQAIGGINEKIEGFFEICRTKGLNGHQGVLIPASNIRNLMLKEAVADAIKEGQFHIYPVSTIDEGIEVLTGQKAGQLLEEGNYEPGSINDLVQKRLISLAEKLRDFSKGEESQNGGPKSGDDQS